MRVAVHRIKVVVFALVLVLDFILTTQVTLVGLAKLKQHKRRPAPNSLPPQVQVAVDCVHGRGVDFLFFGAVHRLVDDAGQVPLKRGEETNLGRLVHALCADGVEPELPGNLAADPLSRGRRRRGPGHGRVTHGVHNDAGKSGRLLWRCIVGTLFDDEKEIHQIAADAEVIYHNQACKGCSKMLV